MTPSSLVGDSFVEALQVPLEATVARRLELLCRVQVEVCAFGKSGIGTVEMSRIVRQDVMDLHPDLVLIEFLAMNDVRDNSAALCNRQKYENCRCYLNGKIGRLARFYKLQFLAFLINQIDRFCNSTRLQQNLPFDNGVFLLEQYDADWKDAWARTEAAFVDIFRFCRNRSIRVGVATFSHPFLIGAYADGPNRRLQAALKHYADEGLILDFKYPDQRIQRLCHQQDVPFLNLSREFARFPAAVRESLHFKSDSHWTVRGHEGAARALSRMIDRIARSN